MRHHRFELVLSLVTVFAVAGCASAPRGRPLPTERVEERSNSTTAVRKQFEGQWSLISFRSAVRTGGRRTSMPPAISV